jgi:hypothetical protein
VGGPIVGRVDDKSRIGKSERLSPEIGRLEKSFN